FVSSRRRHTRSKRDWSSDVCSSDLEVHGGGQSRVRGEVRALLEDHLGHALGGAGRGRRLQNDQLTALELLGDRTGGRFDVGEVRSEERRVGKEGGCRCWQRAGARAK